MLGEKGFNELDMSLLKHLLFNGKPVAFVRTQCDAAITGLQNTYAEEVGFYPISPSFKKAVARRLGRRVVLGRCVTESSKRIP